MCDDLWEIHDVFLISQTNMIHLSEINTTQPEYTDDERYYLQDV